jgi:hypothetical protein
MLQRMIEAAVMRDLLAGSSSPSFREAAYSPRAPGDIRLQAGFSGWIPQGSLAAFLAKGSRRANADMRRLLSRRAGFQIRSGTPLLYRLLRHNPKAKRKYRTLYIGSSRDGNVAGRLSSHVNGTRDGSQALYRWLNPPGSAQKDLGKIYLHVGYATHQPPAGSRFRQSINYNELFLMEKMLQRQERPLVWDPNDRTFDESPAGPVTIW